MMEELNACPVCKNTQISHKKSICDYSITKEFFSIMICSSCGFLFTNPRPPADKIGRYYESDDYISHSDSDKGLISKLYKFIRNIALKSKLKLMEKHCAGDRTLLDYGAGTGAFLSVAKSNGWHVQGLEPNDSARMVALEKHAIELKDSLALYALPSNSIGTITLWHVLEHIHLLDETIWELKRVLRDNGTMIIALPNCSSHDAIYYGDYWAAYDVPRHLYHFQPFHVEQFAKRHRLEIVEYVPMKFDAFYVSMLSEKYKTGSTNYLKAFLQGWKSNRAAKGDSKKFSSVIYILKKNKSK